MIVDSSSQVKQVSPNIQYKDSMRAPPPLCTGNLSGCPLCFYTGLETHDCSSGGFASV